MTGHAARCWWLGVFVVIGTSAPPARAEIVVNGGFETGNFFPWTVPQIALPPNPNPSLFFVSGGGGHSGDFYGRLSSLNLQFMSQVLPTVAGTDYELSFWLRVPDLLLGHAFTVRWEGQSVFTQFVPQVPWTRFSLPLHSNITGSFLQFGQSAFPGEYHIDDISVVQVPAPSPAALLGVAGLLALRRKRR